MADIEINLESTDPKELLRSGHHAFVMKDYGNAAAALGKATQLMAQEHGDEHDSLGEVYLHYGRALLEVSRDEAEPLGDAIPHGDSDSDDEDEGGEENSESNEESKENGDTAKENGDTEKQNGEAEIQNGDAEKENGDEKTETKDEETNGNETKENEDIVGSSNETAGPSTSNGENGESTEETPDKDQDPTDLQLAWEVLEVAKKIFTARGDTGKELLSQTLILLGEVGMESENFSDAVKDIQAGLELQESLFEKTSRKLAETQYKLGMAHATLSNIEEAVKYFESSISTLNQRIELLKEKDDEVSKKEIQEMEELLPEIKEKINDTKSIKDDTVKMLMDNLQTMKSAEVIETTSPNKDVKDISHLVKRKRKPEEEPSETPEAKKPTP